uniref:Uncharacterized protein n=1 Tax=Avena sativa TaxID=4498 RepID=A0ACD5XYE4_AVESA
MAVAADRPDAVGVREDGGAGEEAGRGRRYEAYVRRRDEKLRQGWLARMERKEAEVKALWARLDNTGSAGGRRRGPDDAGVTASPAREQKPRSIEKPVPPATPRCIAAMKLPRLRSSASSSSLGSASPRLPSKTPRSTYPEAPTTPRKENRMPPPSAAAGTPRPPKTLSRTRSSLKDSGKVERSSVSSSSSSSSSVRESPRPPRFQAPRAPAPPPSAAEAAVAAARSRFHEQVVLAEIKTAAVVSPEPSRLGRSRVGVAGAWSPSLTPGQVDFLSRLGHNGRDYREASEHSGAKGKNSVSVTEAGGNGDKPGDAEITGDSDTEPSYVYVKRDHEEAGEEQEAETVEETMASSPPSSEETGTTVKESPSTIGVEVSPRDSSETLYSNVQSSFSHGSELDASAAGSPLPTTPPSGGSLSTEELLESDAATLRMKREQEEVVEEDGAEDQSIVLLTSTCCSARSGTVVPVAGRPQSPMEAVAGLRRFLTFGKKNGKGADDADVVVVIERAPPSAGVVAVSQRQRPASGDPTKPRTCGSDAARDDRDNTNVMSPRVRSLQSFVPSSPARSQLKEMAPPAKSPAVHRSFFSFSSFKNRGN